MSVYFLFAKDWKAISQQFMVMRVYKKWNHFMSTVHIYVRVFSVMMNEVVMFAIIACTNIGEDRGIGIIVNFSAALIICEIDDLLMVTARIHRYREYFENQPNESEKDTKVKNCDFYKIGDRKFAHCGFMKVCIPKKQKVGDNLCICMLSCPCLFDECAEVIRAIISKCFCCCKSLDRCDRASGKVKACCKTCCFDKFSQCCGKFWGKILSCFSCFKHFEKISFGFNSGTFHRLMLMTAFGYLIWSDFFRYDENEFRKAAVRQGAIITASSSWLPLYPIENAILFEELIDPKIMTNSEN